jgi:hypothetical protein
VSRSRNGSGKRTGLTLKISFQPARCRLDNSRYHAGKSFWASPYSCAVISAIPGKEGRSHEQVKHKELYRQCNEEREV